MVVKENVSMLLNAYHDEIRSRSPKSYAVWQENRTVMPAGVGSLFRLGRALAIAPNSEDVMNAFAQVSLAARAPVPALQVLEPLARMCPTVAQYHYMLGVALMQAGDVQASTAPLREADRLEPSRPFTLIAFGLVLNTQKNTARRSRTSSAASTSSPTTWRRWRRSRSRRRASASWRRRRRMRCARSRGCPTTRSGTSRWGWCA